MTSEIKNYRNSTNFPVNGLMASIRGEEQAARAKLARHPNDPKMQAEVQGALARLKVAMAWLTRVKKQGFDIKSIDIKPGERPKGMPEAVYRRWLKLGGTYQYDMNGGRVRV